MDTLIHRATEDGEGISLEEVLREAVLRGNEAVSQVLAEIRDFQSEQIAEVLTGNSNLKLQYSKDYGKTWNNEHRLRSFFPDITKEYDILQRVAQLSEGEQLFLANPLPPAVIKCLIEYMASSHIRIQPSVKPNGNPNIKPSNKNREMLKVTCLKEGGKYHSLAAPSMVGIDYRLRGIEDIAKEMQKVSPDHEFTFQNIGNVPVFVKHPAFMVELELENRFPGLKKKLKEGEYPFSDEDWEAIYNHLLPAYPPTGGVPKFNEYVVKEAEKRASKNDSKNVLKQSDVIPTCGAAYAIQCLRMVISGKRRFLHTLPSYPVQTDIELAIAKSFDPKAELIGSDMKINKKLDIWEPNFEEIEAKLRNPENNIGIISIIHPSNPTGHVWTTEDLKKLFTIANESGAMIECDETYWQILAPGTDFVSAGVIASEMGTPVIVYRSASKDALKCGDKFGWVEFYNFDEDPRLAEIKKAFFNLQQEAVGATAIQKIIPLIYEHPKYKDFIANLNNKIFATAQEIKKCFEGIDGVTCISPKGAMYTSVVFDERVLGDFQLMNIEDNDLRTFVEDKVETLKPPWDEQFLIYLIAKTGVVASPLSGFRGANYGFRVCNFEFDLEKVGNIYTQVANAVKEYLRS